MVDLKTTYLGMTLENPLVASSSPLTQKVDTIRKLEESGVAAIVMYSLFEEQILRESLKLDRDLARGAESFAEAITYLPDYGQYTIGPDSYVDNLSKVRKAVHCPVIGSLNGFSTGGWIDYAKMIEDAGADALELNMYYLATDVALTCGELEEQQITLVSDIRRRIRIPIAVKLSPFYTALPNFAGRLVEAGADGLVLFNRFYQPDFDLEKLEVVPNLVLSNSNEMRLPLRWIAILYGQVKADFALTSGIHTANDMLKALMAGAKVAMMASELMQHGIERVPQVLAELQDWMVEHEYKSVQQMIGSMSQRAVADPAAFERANYMKVLSSY
jgi:dihydroorotate dehydrogenase (fumarate)